jgi:hypothetical protein
MRGFIMKSGLFAFLILTCIFAFSGCATIMKGYESKVYIKTDLKLKKVSDQNNQILNFNTIHKKKYEKRLNPETNKNEVTSKIVGTKYELKLKSGKEHYLILETENGKKTVYLYPKISFGWAFVDIITGILPGIIDAYTGNWTHFDDIDIPTKSTKNKKE